MFWHLNPDNLKVYIKPIIQHKKRKGLKVLGGNHQIFCFTYEDYFDHNENLEGTNFFILFFTLGSYRNLHLSNQPQDKYGNGLCWKFLLIQAMDRDLGIMKRTMLSPRNRFMFTGMSLRSSVTNMD